MGVIIDSCKQHIECCNDTEDKNLITEPNANSRKLTFSEYDENEIFRNETDDKIKK